MSLLIDIIVISAFALCFVSGVKKGFVRSVMGVAVVLLAIIGTFMFSPKVSGIVNEKIVYTPVENTVRSAVGKLTDTVDMDTLIDTRPPAFLSMLDRFGISDDDVDDIVYESEQESDEEKTEKVIKYIAQKVSAPVSDAVSFVLVFLALLVGLFIIILLLVLIVKLPILKTADKLLGGILGLATGTLLAWGLSLAITAIMPHLAVLYEGVVPQSVIDNSIVVKFLGSFNPLSIIK